MSSASTNSQWEIGKLHLRADLIWALALSSLKVRVTRALVTGLTIATTTAFMAYLLTMPVENTQAPYAPGLAGMIGLRSDQSQEAIQGFLLMMVLALVVAAAGVFNTMLMNVSQRYREIGTIKCLGGLDELVLFSVLVEAAFLGLIGAIIGVIIGVGVSFILSVVDYGFDFVSHLNLAGWYIKIPFVFVVGMFLTTAGAAVPAWIAAKMPPIEAMRGEK